MIFSVEYNYIICEKLTHKYRIVRSAKVSFFRSVTSRNENWMHVVFFKTGVVYQYM